MKVIQQALEQCGLPAAAVQAIFDQADTLGLDAGAVGLTLASYGAGMVLGALAVQTRHIRLSSAVTILSSADPVRVFQDFATIDLLSGGRAEIMAGRGSFIESFPLFGYDLDDYETLFEEKLDLFSLLLHEEEIPRSGVRVVRRWQSARAPSGRLVTWLGRRKGPGRGDAASGVLFDTLDTVDTPTGTGET